MSIKASELKKLLGDIADADRIVADRISTGAVENDLQAESTVFKSSDVSALIKSLTEAADRLVKLPTEAPVREVDEREQRLAKSRAAENAPEVVGAITDLARVVDTIEKSQVEAQSALAKSLNEVVKAQSLVLNGLLDFSTRYESLSSKVDELHKAASTTVIAPVGTAGTAAPSPLDSQEDLRKSFRGETSMEAYINKYTEIETLIKGAIRAVPAGEARGARARELERALVELTTNPDKELSAIVAEYSLK